MTLPAITAADVFLTVIAALVTVAVFLRMTLFAGLQVRRMRWRTIFRLRPGPGFATIVELWWRWGRIEMLRHSKNIRPDLTFPQRLFARTTTYGCYLGRGPYFRKCFSNPEHQTITIAPPRKQKTGQLGDEIIDWPGAVLDHETRPGCYFGTAGYRARGGRPVMTFNPDGLGGIPSTFGWAITQGCDDPAEAIYRAADLVGAVADIGEMRWWAEKAALALGAGMHMAGVLSTAGSPDQQATALLATALHAGADMTAVWEWAYGSPTLVTRAAEHPDASLPLIGALTELDKPGKTADSVKITMSKALAWMAIPSLREMVTGPNARPFDVGRWIFSCGTIYMISPGGEQSPSAPLFRAFTSYCHREAKKIASSLLGGKLAPGPLFALDEIDKCPIDLPKWLSDSAGFGIRIHAVAHGTGQLEDKHGRAGLDTIMATTGVKIFLGGNHVVKTLQDVSILCGTLEHGEARGLNPVVPVEYLARMPRKRGLIINDDLFPTVVKVRAYWRRIRHRLGLYPRPPQLVSAAQAITGNGHIPDTVPLAPVGAGGPALDAFEDFIDRNPDAAA
jgi:type IV secretion system protein VirD4